MGSSEQREAIELTREALRTEWRRTGVHPGINIIDAVHSWTAQRTDQLDFYSPERSTHTTLGEVFDEGARIAAVLLEMGHKPGEAIALHLPNWSESILTLYVAILLRAVIVPIPSIYRMAEIRFILEDSKVTTYVGCDQWRKHDNTDDLKELVSSGQVNRVVVVGDSGPEGSVSWAELVDRAKDATPVPVDAYPTSSGDVAFIVYTSGSTSNPKGAKHSHDTMLSEFEQNRFNFAREGVHLSTYPGGHLGGLFGILRPLLYGRDSVILDQWDADAAASYVDERKIVSMTGPPYFLSTLLDSAETHGKNLESVLDFSTGGTGVPSSLIERADKAGIHPYRTYGSTEHPTVATNAYSDTVFERSQTDGVALKDVRIMIGDDDDNAVVPGSEGQILTLGPDQFLGYTDQEANDAAFARGGWFRTGDLGCINDEGRLVITGRKKDVIIRGGENLSALEIEDVLARHAAVVEVAVIGVPDEKFGERACAFVVLRSGAQLTIDDVREHFRVSEVARQKTPERLVVMEELPRTSSGKVQKQILRADYVPTDE
jgi:acyl-CoA synthetase (AMP-forming)/AMP-acid ligase II